MRGVLLAAGLVLALAGCGGDDSSKNAAGPSAGDLGLYQYKADAPLGYRDLGKINHDYPIAIHDVSYASPRGGTVPAYLALPPGRGPFPAAIFLHGSGGNRGDLVPIAGWLAGGGAVALTIESADSRHGEPTNLLPGLAGLKRQRDLAVQTVVDLRRGVDLLQSLPQVDDDRIGFLGFSAGAKSGAVFAGVEPRLKAVVLVSGGAPSLDRALLGAPVNLRPAVRRLLAATDPSRYIGRSKATLLLQIGKEDEYVPQADLQRLADAAADPEVRRYGAGHQLVTNVVAIRDALDFLSRELVIKGPPVKGALTGPKG
jgi:dienelactone hydrolase